MAPSKATKLRAANAKVTEKNEASTTRATRSKGPVAVVAEEPSVVKKAAPARKIKVATGTKGTKPKTTSAIKLEVIEDEFDTEDSLAPTVAPIVNIVRPAPQYGTQEYNDWARERYEAFRAERAAAREEKKRQKKKQQEQEDIIFAKDVEDSDTERKPRKKNRHRNYYQRQEDARQAVKDKGLKAYWTRPTGKGKGKKKVDDTCYFFKLPREIRDMIYGYVFEKRHSYTPVDMVKSYGERICWDLPGIFTANNATYEESRVIWLSRSTVSLSLKESRFRALLNRLTSQTRGLRTNKGTDESKEFLEAVTQFSNVVIKLDHHYGQPKTSQAIPLAVALDFFSKLDFSEGKRVAVDLTTLYTVHTTEAKEVVKCVADYMAKFQEMELVKIPDVYWNPSWYGFQATANKQLYDGLIKKYPKRVIETNAL